MAAYPKRQTTRPAAASYDPLKERARWLANTLYERAKKIAEVMAPDVPSDMEEIPEDMQWRVLELVSTQLSPEFWDDPDAILDLYKLRKRFAPTLADERLPLIADFKRKERAMLPDPDITPESPEFEKQMARMKR